MGGKKGMKEERNEVRQMKRLEDICSNKMHNELKMQKTIQCNNVM
jgi:hypothetical protein